MKTIMHSEFEEKLYNAIDTFTGNREVHTPRLVKDLVAIFNEENQSLRSKLQKQKDEFNYMRDSFHQLNKQLMDDLVKQKELNAELVEVGSQLINPGTLFSEDLFDVALEKFKSLIKKSKES